MACEGMIADTERDFLIIIRDTLIMPMTKMTDYDVLSEVWIYSYLFRMVNL
uniref:Neur_chan_LBD domain-containing protein n=1 Tax=Angiostrongylus cantonensis TaxID=6313 RepID=A0A0K0D8B0_ANGCA